MIRIGVYGTLKKNHHANELIRKKDGNIFIKEGNYNIPYEMKNTGWYPALIPDTKKNSIFLEIYDITKETKKAIDAYEGYPNLFNINTVSIEGEDVYIYTYKNFENIKHLETVKNGCW